MRLKGGAVVIQQYSRILASDFLQLTFFPKGTVLMYDGTGWADDSTIPGWYSCGGQTTPYGKTPDMLNRFIRGATANGYGGNNAVPPPAPPHKHNINNTPRLNSESMEQHGHEISVAMLPSSGYGFTAKNTSWDTNVGLGPDKTSTQRTLTISRISPESHTHSITAVIGYAGQGNALDIRPDYYRVIFIVKMI
jgi:hypothetical protein